MIGTKGSAFALLSYALLHVTHPGLNLLTAWWSFIKFTYLTRTVLEPAVVLCWLPAAVYPINLNSTANLYTPKIIGAHITLQYYGGFSYLMLGRYLDAARVLNSVLAHINRVKQYHARSPQYDQVRACTPSYACLGPCFPPIILSLIICEPCGLLSVISQQLFIPFPYNHGGT